MGEIFNTPLLPYPHTPIPLTPSVVKDWISEIRRYIGDFTRRISIKVRLAHLRRTRLKKFKELGKLVFNAAVNRVSDASLDPSLKSLIEELAEQDREISKLSLELK
ncbi:MAG TPA: hypothetical protein VNM22_17200 [Candidatus Limnocylindrales bacterium]|nr:hypothetical protein [Candidatus Limnocylindrales bacterium]